MPGRASILFVLLVVTTGAVLAQPAATRSPFELGKAAMDAHDPAAAIAHFEQADSKAARAWLAAALMMESRSPSDHYVERAFDAAARARTDQPSSVRPRAALATSLRAGDLVVTFLVGESHAYGWAFDREHLIGYPLPPAAEIATAVARVNAYAAQNDRAGMQRIADNLLPAILGPVFDRIPALTRVIFVMDGPLRQLSIGELPIGQDAATLAQRLAVSVVEDDALFDEIARTPPPPKPAAPWPLIAVLAVTAAVVAVSLLRRRRSRERS